MRITSHLEKLRDVLKELFQLDQAELDFGIYRIMNAKRDEVTRFLDDDLLPQVRAVLATALGADQQTLKAQLDGAIEQARNLGVDPDSVPRVKELKAQFDAAGDPATLEEQVYSHLASFFRRYYHEGDFISLRRYKPGVYAIPYEGEEVKLHSANADQYYIKTSETLRDYTFKLSDGRRVHFKVVAADSEKDNTKAAAGQERRFILAETNPVVEEGGELVIRFEHRPDPDKRKQVELSTLAARTILATAPQTWALELAASRPTEKNPTRTLLDKHLADYTARNTFDYFIHKDLGGFLRRELDFYIKNEVMHLDDIEDAAAPRVEGYLATVKAIRRIAHKIIDFLAQIEDFQKKLWLKKKFIVDTQWCVTLDRVPKELYPEIAANAGQTEEWETLYAISEIPETLFHRGSADTDQIAFLKANPYLVVDTRHFGKAFTEKLEASWEDVDGQTGGVIIQGENFQALNLLQDRYREQVKCIYIDPPYNTDASAIAYKNGYKDSSWLALMEDRLTAGLRCLLPNGVACIAIDDVEFARLRCQIDATFGPDATLGVAAVRSNPAGRSTPKGFAEAHEYAIFIAASEEAAVGRVPRTPRQLARYSEKDDVGRFEWVNFRKHGGREATREARPRMFYPLFAKNGQARLPRLEWNGTTSAWHLLEEPEPGEEVVLPINESGQELRWKWGREAFARESAHFCSRLDQSGKTGIYMKSRINETGMLPVTWWDDKEYSATEYGTNLLTRMFGNITEFSFPKALKLVGDCLRASDVRDDSTVLDFFAGSGTTAHAVIGLNREDGGSRKYILVEMGGYFDTVLVPRIKKVVYSKAWKDGKPVSREGISHCFKVLRLESYEDTLNNLEWRERTPFQQTLLAERREFREDFILRYMLDVETKGSHSLLDLSQLDDPFAYTLQVATGSVGETRPITVDLVETLNYLLGLRVKHRDTIRGVTVVQATNTVGEKVLVLWRRLRDTDNSTLAEWFAKQGYNTQDQEYDLVYVNGDNTLENLRRPDQTWKVRLIEEELQRLMFDPREV